MHACQSPSPSFTPEALKVLYTTYSDLRDISLGDISYPFARAQDSPELRDPEFIPTLENILVIASRGDSKNSVGGVILTVDICSLTNVEGFPRKPLYWGYAPSPYCLLSLPIKPVSPFVQNTVLGIVLYKNTRALLEIGANQWEALRQAIAEMSKMQDAERAEFLKEPYVCLLIDKKLALHIGVDLLQKIHCLYKHLDNNKSLDDPSNLGIYYAMLAATMQATRTVYNPGISDQSCAVSELIARWVLDCAVELCSNGTVQQTVNWDGLESLLTQDSVFNV